MKPKFIILSIDGGAGTGKSTTAHSLAESLNLLHVDTGSHYRAVTKALLDLEVSSAEAHEYLNKNELSLGTEVDGRRSCLVINQNMYDQTELRSPEINEVVSDFSSQSCIRKLLFDYQRSQVDFAKESKLSGVVMEGRDIGTVILPDADLKIFLEADSSIRANRRMQDGESDQISNRDEKDTTRKISPLTPADDCIHVDTGILGVDEVKKLLLDIVGKLP